MGASDEPLQRLTQAAREAGTADEFLDDAEYLLGETFGTVYLWLGECRGPQHIVFHTRGFDPLIAGLTGSVRDTNHPAWRAVELETPLWLDHIDRDSWVRETGCQHGWVIPYEDRAFLLGLAETGAPVSASQRGLLHRIGRMALIIDADADRPQRLAALGSLTLRQRIVLNLAASGQSNSEIADYLCMSRATITQDLAHALEALGVQSRSDVAQLLAADRLLERLDEVG